VPRWRIDLEYDGSGFAGWQLQPDQPTVQGALEGALASLVGESVRVRGAGRTDAGVHALQQVAHFDCEAVRSERGMRDGLNAKLPDTVACLEATPVSDTFSARHSPHTKTYCYRWLVRAARPALLRDRCWHERRGLDVAAMARAVEPLVGTHDFTSFRAQGCSAKHPVRTIEGVSVTAAGDLVELRIQGTGFLRHMVRILAGTLHEVGRGKRSEEELIGAVRALDRRAAGRTAPAGGLLLESIHYHASS
jgi:tRNA pseudouridine38-40 synthase